MSRKKNILDAAIQLFAEKGYNGTATSEIVKKAGVAQGTLFYHFHNKEEMLLTILENILNDYLQELEKAVLKTPTGLQGIENLIRTGIHFRQTRSLELLVLMRDFPSDLVKQDSTQMVFIIEFFTRLHNMYKDCLIKGMEDGSIRQVDADKYTHIIIATISGLDRHTLLSPMPSPDVAEEIIDFYHHSLAQKSEGLQPENGVTDVQDA